MMSKDLMLHNFWGYNSYLCDYKNMREVAYASAYAYDKVLKKK